MSKIFRLTLSGEYMGSNWANVWHYLSESDDDFQAGDLISGWNTEWLNALRGIMNNQVNFGQVSAVDVPDEGDYASAIYAGITGTFGTNGTKLPPAYTTAFTINTLGSPIRHGFKRFVGVDEDMIAAGIPSTAFNTAVTTLLPKFTSNIEFDGYLFQPIIPRYTGTPSVITMRAFITGAAFKRFGYQRTRES